MRSKFARLLLPLACTLLPVAAHAAKKVACWLTNPDGSALFAPQNPRLRFTSAPAQPPILQVDDQQKFQTVDGFGYALTGGSAQLLMAMEPAKRAAILRELFSTQGNGIGVSFLRVTIGSSDMNDHVYSYDDVPAGQTDPDLAKFSLAADRDNVIAVLKQILAIDPKIQLLASPWSAPAWMKTNGDAKGGELLPRFYPAYAEYFVKYLTGMRQEGIPIDAITVQNEPLNDKNTPSMRMPASDEARFIRDDLGPALRRAGLKTKIVLYDHNCDAPEYPLSILRDPAASQYVAGSGFHLYAGPIDALTTVHDAFPDKNIYFTEQMVIDSGNTAGRNIANPVQRILIGAMRNWSRNVLLWNLAADPRNGPHTNNGGCPVCQGAITIDGDTVTRNRAYYALAHFSKFVRPGSVRIGSNQPASLANVAFRTPRGRFVLVVANTGPSQQTFRVAFHQRAFTATLQAGSVATYVW